jgi:hypothetical protein
MASALGGLKKVPEPLGCWRVHGDNNTWRGRFDERLRDEVQRWEHCFDALEAVARRQGIDVDRARWRERSWWHRMAGAVAQIAAVVPVGETFILADEDRWAAGERVTGRRRLQFPERDGLYWGPPADDVAAVEELERLRQAGAGFIVFAWPAFWWLDHYTGLSAHLHSKYRSMLSTEHLRVFALQKQRAGQSRRAMVHA